MTVIAANGWDIAVYVFGVFCIVGPFLLLFWYWETAHKRFRELGEEQEPPK